MDFASILFCEQVCAFLSKPSLDTLYQNLSEATNWSIPVSEHAEKRVTHFLEFSMRSRQVTLSENDDVRYARVKQIKLGNSFCDRLNYKRTKKLNEKMRKFKRYFGPESELVIDQWSTSTRHFIGLFLKNKAIFNHAFLSLDLTMTALPKAFLKNQFSFKNLTSLKILGDIDDSFNRPIWNAIRQLQLEHFSSTRKRFVHTTIIHPNFFNICVGKWLYNDKFSFHLLGSTRLSHQKISEFLKCWENSTLVAEIKCKWARRNPYFEGKYLLAASEQTKYYNGYWTIFNLKSKKRGAPDEFIGAPSIRANHPIFKDEDFLF
ncbi:hypothetical protein L596_025288 [Steinernema carpocapsae]|uniref:Uncharacterized protein n=1 Tax=Steinernema carpocapsae TaxID=34508 RepID=A0A4U5M7C5_STECR|nr:hypothetical protein L596_025288 [Steinernema carpocapsae]